MNAPLGWVPGLRVNLLRWNSNAPKREPGGVDESGRFMAKRAPKKAIKQAKSKRHGTLFELEEIKRDRDNKFGPLYRLEALRSAKMPGCVDFSMWHMPDTYDPVGIPVDVPRRRRESETLNAIRALLQFTHEALGNGDWSSLHRVGDAMRSMAGLNFVQTKIAVALWEVTNALLSVSQDQNRNGEVAALMLIRLEAIDFRFGGIATPEAREILEDAHRVAPSNEDRRKGGRGKGGARWALTKLARACGALDAAETPDFEQAIANAVKASKRRSPKE